MPVTQSLSFSGDLSSLEHYLAQVAQIPVLSATAEQQLARRWWDQADLDAARQLVMSQLRLPVQVARQYRGYGLPQADLIQEGNIGLMKAVKRFDPRFGVRLATFALHWVKAEVHEFILRNWRIVKIATTKAQRKLFFKLRQATRHVGWLSAPETAQLAEQFAVPASTVREMAQRLRYPDLAFDPELDEDTAEAGALAPADYLADPNADPMQQVLVDEQRQQEQQLRQALTTLDARSQQILERRWLVEPKATLQELAAEWGISAERVRQLEQAALHNLRNTLAA